MVVKGRIITNKNGKQKQVFKFQTISKLIQYKVGKNGKKEEQKDKHGSKVIKTVNMSKGVRGAATTAAKSIYKNVLRSMALRNSIKNSTKRHTMKMTIYLVTRTKKDRIIFNYECSGLLKPVSKKKSI